MATNITPPLLVTGQFTANTPFDKLIDPQTRYTVSAVRTIPEMLGMNVDVLALVYTAAGLGDAQYQADIAAGANIITLTSGTKAPVYIPSTSLASYPDDSGVIYERLILGLDCGLVPAELKDTLTTLKQRLIDEVLANIGVTTTVTVGVVPTTGFISDEQHRINEANRQGKISNASTDKTRILQLEAQVSQLQATVDYYEQQFTASTGN